MQHLRHIEPPPATTTSSTTRRTSEVAANISLQGPVLVTPLQLTIDEIFDRALDDFDRDDSPPTRLSPTTLPSTVSPPVLPDLLLLQMRLCHQISELRSYLHANSVAANYSPPNSIPPTTLTSAVVPPVLPIRMLPYSRRINPCQQLSLPPHLLHQISDAALRVFSYLTLRDMCIAVVNRNTARIFGEPNGINPAAFREQLEANNSAKKPLTYQQYQTSARLGGPRPSPQHIRHLDVNHSEITDEILQNLIQQFPHLETLNLQGCKNITDIGLMSLAGLSNLQVLNLSGCKITNESLAYLARLNKLHTLDIWNSTPFYTEDCLVRHLSNLPLQTLKATNSISDASLALLRLQRVPNRHITYRSIIN